MSRSIWINLSTYAEEHEGYTTSYRNGLRWPSEGDECQVRLASGEETTAHVEGGIGGGWGFYSESGETLDVAAVQVSR